MFDKSFENLTEQISPDHVREDYGKARDAFKKAIDRFKKVPGSVKSIILGEAPVSFDDYFYNLENKKKSPFIRSGDFEEPDNNITKEEMINILTKAGILIVDVYPLPLPSRFYRGGVFYDLGELERYWEELCEDLKGIVDKRAGLYRRYKGIPDSEQLKAIKSIFVEHLGIADSEIKSLASTHMGINRKEFRKLLGNQ